MSRLSVVFFLAASMLIFSSGCGVKDEQKPSTGLTLEAAFNSEAPVIDGILNDKCWENAETYQLLPQGNGVISPTLVRTAWNNSSLFIAFECRDNDAATSVNSRDSDFSNSDYVSILLDADKKPSTAAIIRIAPNGVFSDAYCLVDVQDGKVKELYDWNIEGIRVSASVYGGDASPGTQDRFWTVEISLPFSEFPTSIPPQQSGGDSWNVGFGRADITEAGTLRSYLGVDTTTYRQALCLLIFGG